MEFELKKITHNKRLSQETEAFAAELYIDGKRAAEVSNSGTGGPHCWHWFDKDQHRQYQEHVKSLPRVEYDWGGYQPDEDYIVDNLLQEFLMQKQYKRWVKGGARTVFRLKEDKGGSFRIHNMEWSPANKAKIIAEFGADKIDFFVNEKIK